ncbi:MAG: hypothetical protein JWN76_1853 [Chitinophagaceae bacterium]|nr:hypothetical protein [Chitinophagaceae bacterium]
MPYGEHSKTDLSPYNLYEQEIENPHLVIDEYFNINSLKSHRRYITNLLMAAGSPFIYKDGPATDMLFSYDGLVRLIEAANIILARYKEVISRDSSVIIKTDLYAETLPDTSSYNGWNQHSSLWDFFPRYLSRKEFLNPYKVFKTFFKQENLGDWRDCLRDVKDHGLRKETCYAEDKHINLLYLHQHLQKLIEASHLIYIRRKSPNKV